MDRKVVLSLAMVAGLSTGLWADDRELRDLFRQAVTSFEEGEVQAAVGKLRELFAQDPSSSLAYECVEEGGYRLFVAMISEGGDITTMAKKLLQLAEQRIKKDTPPVAKIRELLDQLREDDWVKSRVAMEKLVMEVGPYVVPYCIEALADQRNDEYRATVLQLLIKLADNAVLPLAEILKSKNSFLRQQAVIALGHIGDLRGVPYLLNTYEDAESDQHVKAEAAKALKKITGREPSGLGSAKEWLLSDAHLYYNEHPRLCVNYYKKWFLWSWKEEGEGKLEYREIPSFGWNEQMAEELCYLALQRDPSFDPAWDLLVNAYIGQAVEAESVLEVVQAKLDNSETEGVVEGVIVDLAELASEMENGQKAMARVRMLCLARGNQVLYKALYRAMHDKKIDVAVGIIQALQQLEVPEKDLPGPQVSLADYLDKAVARTGPMPGGAPTKPAATPRANTPAAQPPPAEPKPEDQPKPEDPPAEPSGRPRRNPRTSSLGETEMLAQASKADRLLFAPDTGFAEMPQGYPAATPLPAALGHEDKRVRFHAAIALAKLDTQAPFANSAAVIENLAEAIGQLGQRVILVVENDPNIRNRIVGMLKNMGYLAFSVAKGTDALHRARMFPSQDLVIFSTDLNEGGKADDMTAEEFVNTMKKDYRTDRIPVILLTSSSDRRTYEANMKETEKVADVISHDVGDVALRDKLNLIFDKPNFRGDSKTKAVAMAAKAAEALSQIDPRRGIFPIDSATLKSSIKQALELQPDPVRIPVLHAVGRLKIYDAFEASIDIFNNTDNSPEVRVAAAFAIGELLREKELTENAYVSLKSGMAEDDPSVSLAAAEALGKAQVDPERMLKVFLDQRVE